jgi:hypothetical protein
MRTWCVSGAWTALYDAFNHAGKHKFGIKSTTDYCRPKRQAGKGKTDGNPQIAVH